MSDNERINCWPMAMNERKRERERERVDRGKNATNEPSSLDAVERSPLGMDGSEWIKPNCPTPPHRLTTNISFLVAPSSVRKRTEYGKRKICKKKKLNKVHFS